MKKSEHCITMCSVDKCKEREVESSCCTYCMKDIVSDSSVFLKMLYFINYDSNLIQEAISQVIHPPKKSSNYWQHFDLFLIIFCLCVFVRAHSFQGSPG